MNKVDKRKVLMFFVIGWAFMEASYSSGTIRLIVDELFSVERIAPGSEGEVLFQENGVVSWKDNPIIDTDMTINIPGDYLSLDDVMGYLGDKKITSNATVTIKFADGTYNLGTAFIFYHPDGRNIEIIGNTASPGNVTLNCTKSAFRFQGSTLKNLDGFTLDGGGNSFEGVYISHSSMVTIGSAVIIQNFKYGLVVNLNSLAIVDGLTISNSSIAGIRVVNNGFLRMSNSSVLNSTSSGVMVLRSGYLRSVNNIINGSGGFAYFTGVHSLVELSGGSNTGSLSNRALNTQDTTNSYIRTF